MKFMAGVWAMVVGVALMPIGSAQMSGGDQGKSKRVMQAVMQMDKLDIQTLEQA